MMYKYLTLTMRHWFSHLCEGEYKSFYYFYTPSESLLNKQHDSYGTKQRRHTQA